MWRDGTDGLFHKPDLMRSKLQQGDRRSLAEFKDESHFKLWNWFWPVVFTLFITAFVIGLVGCGPPAQRPPEGTVTAKSRCCMKVRVEGLSNYVSVSPEDYNRPLGWNYFHPPVEVEKLWIPEDPPKNVYPSGYTPESPR